MKTSPPIAIQLTFIALVSTLTALPATADGFESHIRTWDLPRKKIIEWDWETAFLSLDYLQTNVRSLERIPFDGLAITINYQGRTYKDGLCHEVKWTEEEMQPVYDALAAIEWDAYRHNFILAFAGEKHLGADSKVTMDWFDDDHWDNILHNIRLLARAAVKGGCAGVLFDPETYHRTLWNYYPNPGRRQPAVQHFDTKSYDEYFDQVRKRGAQYMAAIQLEMPEVVFLNAYLAIRVGPSDTAKSIYGLYHAFLNGLLDAAGPGVVFVDGNESSYGYKTKADYDRGYSDIRHRKLALIAPENRRKYRAQVQASHALYMDEIFGIQQARRWTGSYLSYPDRLRLFEEGLVHAMDAADEYVWIYAEKMNWRNEAVPEGAIDTMRRAKNRIRPLTIEKREGDAALDAAVREAIGKRDLLGEWSDRAAGNVPLTKPKRALIHHIGPGQAGPTIDGTLDEGMWERAVELHGFSHLLHYTRHTVVAATVARAAWSDEGLYVGFTCVDPNMERLRENSEELRKTNRLRMVIAADGDASTFYRLNFDMTGFVNMYANRGGERTWNEPLTPEAKPSSAVTIGAEGWTAEWFVPWSCIGGKPEPNRSRKATLLRMRTGPYEYTTWSPMVDPNLWDTGHLGTWVFAPAR